MCVVQQTNNDFNLSCHVMLFTLFFMFIQLSTSDNPHLEDRIKGARLELRIYSIFRLRQF